MSDDVNVQELQKLEQAIISSSSQIRSFRSQLLEIESAINALDSSEKSYKIIGNIMVSSTKEDLAKDLDAKKELIETRLSALEKQEKKLRDSFKERQEAFIEKMNAEKSPDVKNNQKE